MARGGTLTEWRSRLRGRCCAGTRERGLLRAHGLRRQRSRTAEHPGGCRARRLIGRRTRLRTAGAGRRRRAPGRGCWRFRADCGCGRWRLHDARLRHRRAFGRRQGARRLRCFPGFLDPETDCWWDEPSSRLWRCCRHRDRDRYGSLLDWLLDDWWFFYCSRGFGYGHNRRCFLDFDGRWWFNLDS